MRRLNLTWVIGLLLIAAGLLFLLQNFNIFRFDWNLLVALVFLAGGVIFLAVFAGDSNQWWAVIPGFTLAGLGVLIGTSSLSPALGDQLGGSIFLGAIALSFWVIYLVRRNFWWAIIPAGTLTTLAVVAGVGASGFLSAYAGSVFFLGLALTFGLVSILPAAGENLRWALYPAGGLLLMAVITLVAVNPLAQYLWPLIIIAAGVIILISSLRFRKG